ncbi:MAG: T9SS type A sorting domain-containing protein [Ignavibacteriales bacterium]
MKKSLLHFLFLAAALFVMSIGIYAQGHKDPQLLQITSAEKPVKIDGVLNETDWQRRFDYLVFGKYAKPGDVEYTVTSGVVVDSGYVDSTVCQVKFLHRGLELYISLKSNDKSINRRTTGWEGDGLFMKIKDSKGVPLEYKLYYNLPGKKDSIHVETPGTYPNSAQGAGKANGIVNQKSPADSGYTAEMVIHLDQLGYKDPYGDITVLVNIFDPNGFEDSVTTGSYYKSWWGSEWGVGNGGNDPKEWRILRLSDPPTKIAVKADSTIKLDGKLDESFWKNAEFVNIGEGSNSSTGGYYMQWADSNNTYRPKTMSKVMFAHKGTDLYVGVQSDDKSVTRWSPGWEADGMFLWMTNKGQIPAPAERMEVKNMYFKDSIGAHTDFQLSTTVPNGGAEGASFEPVGTITDSETGGPDKGYSLETVIHTDMFGYKDGDTIMVSICMWDMQYSDKNAYSKDTSDYAPHWWGAQWVDPTFEKYYMYRGVILSSQPVGVAGESKSIPVRYALEQNYPNPFNPATKIKYSIPENSLVTLKIYDLIGREVATLVNSQQNAGFHQVEFNASKLGSGIYFYQLSTKNFLQTKKMMLIK